MAGEWRNTTLGEVVRLQRGHDLPDKDRRIGSVPVMGSFGITGSHNEARTKGPGVTIGRSGASIGVVSFIRDHYWPLNTCLYVTDFQGNDPRFCYYWLSTLDLAAYNSGSAQPSLNRNFIYGMPVRVPEPNEQRAIAHILGTLDDKIELNRRMNETLEAIVRALFKSWFVDFDPVRRNMTRRGREQPSPAVSRHPLPLGEGWGEGSVEELDRLFPDSFQDSELGEIPKGWRIGNLGEVADNPRRGIHSEEIEPSTAYIGLEHMPRRCIALAEWGHAGDLGSNKFEFKRGEILFGKLRPYFHKVGVAPMEGVCSMDILVVKPKNIEWFGFVLGHISSATFVDYTNVASTGTRMSRTNWEDMARYQVVLPPQSIAFAFTERIHNLSERILANIHETRTLAAIRDALLPKLISGELRVPASMNEREHQS